MNTAGINGNVFSLGIQSTVADQNSPGVGRQMGDTPAQMTWTKVAQIGGWFDNCSDDLCDPANQEHVAKVLCEMETRRVPSYLTVGAFTPDEYDFPNGALSASRVRDEMHHLAASAALSRKFEAVPLNPQNTVWACAVFTTEPNTLIAGVALTYKTSVGILTPSGLSVNQKLGAFGAVPIPPRSRFSDRLLIRGGDSLAGPAGAPPIGNLSVEWTGLAGMQILPPFDLQPGNSALPSFELGQLVPVPNLPAFSYFTNAGANLANPTFGASWIVTSDVALSGITVRPLAKQNTAALRRLPELMASGTAQQWMPR